VILIPSNGNQLRGDVIKSAVLRSDLAPVPATLEAEIRVDESLKKLLAQDQTIMAQGDLFRIVKSVMTTGGNTQGQHGMSTVKITALLDACHQVTFVRQRSIIKEKATLAEIYRAAGATLKAIDADFAVPRFACFVGGTPSFPIAQVLQEEGGVVRWKSGKMRFFRLLDLMKQKPVMSLPDNTSEDVASGFLERHEVPWFYSLNADGSFAYGNQTKSRSVRYVPFKNALQLQNMTRCLVQKKVSKIHFSEQIAAGDLIDITGAKPLVVVTAAHVFEGGIDGGSGSQYTRLWLSSVES
jgi:hypothetical protein